jgi:3-phenylpropionate/cinnamic acid dioxygenase small subunit
LSSLSNLDPRELLASGTEVLQREALYLDERRWDDWLALYTPDCEYWMPAWKSEDELGQNPRTELSYFYYDNRTGLEDRVARVVSGRSAASSPMPRTTHMLSDIRLRQDPAAGRLALGASWVCQVYFPRLKESRAFFGRVEHDLVLRDENWLIARKKIVLQNDYIPTMLDFYCV